MKKTEQVKTTQTTNKQTKLSTLSSTNSVVTETRGGERGVLCAGERAAGGGGDISACARYAHSRPTGGPQDRWRTHAGAQSQTGSQGLLFFFCKKTKNICSALLTSYLCCAAGAQILAELAGVVRNTTHLQAAENTLQLGGKKTTHNQTLVSHTTDSGGVVVRDVCECVSVFGGREAI